MLFKLDDYDLNILRELQHRGRQSNAELAENVIQLSEIFEKHIKR